MDLEHLLVDLCSDPRCAVCSDPVVSDPVVFIDGVFHQCCLECCFDVVSCDD